MKSNFLVSTTDTLEGYEIEKYFGLCSERIVVGAGFFQSFLLGLQIYLGEDLVLLKNYQLDDIKYLEEVFNKIQVRLTADMREKIRGTFNKDLWVCTCGKKLPISEKKCFNCNSGKNGLDSNECNKIKDVRAFLDGVIIVLKKEANIN
jgi:hypothetical protein